MTGQQPRRPRDVEEAAAFVGMGQAIKTIRERRSVDREALAASCEMTPAEIEALERGEIDESWGGIRLIAKALEMPLGALMIEAEEFAPGTGGEAWRQNTSTPGGGDELPKALGGVTSMTPRRPPSPPSPTKSSSGTS